MSSRMTVLRKRLEPFFPGDPWGMMCFLYWFLDWNGLETQTPDPIEAAAGGPAHRSDVPR